MQQGNFILFSVRRKGQISLLNSRIANKILKLFVTVYIPNQFHARPGSLTDPLEGAQEPAILPRTIPPEVLWYFEDQIRSLNSKPLQNFFTLENQSQDKYQYQPYNLNQGQDQYQELDQAQLEYQDQDNYQDQVDGENQDHVDEEHIKYEDPTTYQEKKLKRSVVDDKFYMTRPGKRYSTRSSYLTRPGKRAAVQGTHIKLGKRVGQQFSNRRREEREEDREGEDEEKLTMARVGKGPTGGCALVRMDQNLVLRCPWNPWIGLSRLRKRSAPAKTGKRDKMFMIRAGKRG